MDNERRVLLDDAVAIKGEGIVAVGPTEKIRATYDADHGIVAADSVVFPGFVDPHVHVSDILLRPAIGNERSHYDLLINVKTPAVSAMTPDEHAVATALYCVEAIQFGITLFVENATNRECSYPAEVVEAKLDVYDDAGIRNVYAQAMADRETSDLTGELVESMRA